MNYYKILIFIFLASQFTKGNCQQDNSIPYNRIEPIEPTAASLGKYGEYKIGYFNGLPDISVPLYTLKSGSLNQNITLTNHGGGIKASEEATWVGLGWDLFFGGSITRQVNGLPDEQEDFRNVPDYQNISRQMADKPYDWGNMYFSSLADANSSPYSFMPDIYHFNLGNYSGKFVLDTINKPLLLPHLPLKVNFDGNNIVMVSPEGNIYTFTPSDQTHIIFPKSGFPDYTSTWYLTSVISPNKQDTIRYEYQQDGYVVNITSSYSEGYTDVLKGCQGDDMVSYKPIPLQSSAYKTQVSSKKPHYIYFKNGRVCFNLSSRKDIFTLNSQQPLQKLESIEIQQKQQDDGYYQTIKTFEFNYSYFSDGAGNGFDQLRLKLDSITELAGDYSLPTIFSYYVDHDLCNKTSFNTDFWGYYNDASNATPIPKSVITLGSYSFEIGGANKNSSESCMKLGTLKGITYPTRGSTQFDWEINRYGNASPVAIPTIATTISVYSNNDPGLIANGQPNPDPDDGRLHYTTFKSAVDQSVTIQYTLYQIANDLTHNKYDRGELDITDITTNRNIFSYSYATFSSASKSTVIYLSANHEYSVSVDNSCYNLVGNIYFVYNGYDPSIDRYNYPIGGLRIKSIKNYDSNLKLLTNKNFTYLNPVNNQSSGVISNDRTLTYGSSSVSVSSVASGQTGCYNTFSNTTLFNSNPITGIYSNSVCYQYVQEYDSDDKKNNGYKEYEYRICNDEVISEKLPVINMEWNRGQLLRETSFKYQSNVPVKVSEIINEYVTDPTSYGLSKGFKMFRYMNVSGYCAFCNGSYNLSNVYGPLNYNYNSYWLKLDRTISTLYNENSSVPVTDTTQYVFDNSIHCQPSRIIHFLENNKRKIEITKYPSDYADGLLVEMKKRNMNSVPIEKQLKVGASGNEKIVLGLYSEYNIDNYNNFVLDKVYKLNISKPITTINDGLLDNRYSVLKPTFLTNEAEYTQEADLNYNASGLMQEEITKGQNILSYIWGYNDAYPIVKAENITASALTTAVNTASSNLKALLISIDNMTTDTQKAAWKSFNTSLRSAMPANTMVTTYTYAPLIGMTSQTDPGGVTMYYEYDSFGRLKCIKNDDGKILKTFDYHYTGQTK